MVKKDNNEKKNNGLNNKEEKNMKKAAKKISVNIIDGVINIVKIDGEACKEPRRFGTYTGGENNILPSITITPKVGGRFKLSAYVAKDENGKLVVMANHEPDAYWAMAEYIMGGKKNVNAAKKALIKARQNVIEKQQQAAQAAQNNNGILVGAETHGYVYSKPMPGAQVEVIDLGKFGKRSMKWSKGLECSKVYDGDKEVAYIFWEKSGKAPRIRLLSEDVKRYYMKAYNQDAFIYYDGDEKVTVMDQKLVNALWFFYRNFVMKLAELKGWELPVAHKGMPKEYWDSLEREHEAEEAARKNSKKADKQ